MPRTARWPIGIVVDKADWSGQRHELPDRDRSGLILGHRAVRFATFFFDGRIVSGN